MDERLSKAADELKKGLEEDLATSYKDLLEFSDQYAPNSEAEDETILLGSEIFESIQKGEDIEIDQNDKETLVSHAIKLVDKILNIAVSSDQEIIEQTKSKLRTRYLKNKSVETTVVKCDNITKTYKRGGFKLKEITQQFSLGEITGVVGENGNGKSTLLKIIAGEILPDTGSITYPKFNFSDTNWVETRKRIGYIKQELRPWGSMNSVKEHLHFQAAIKGITGKENFRVVNHIIQRLGLKKNEDMLWTDLSGGFKLRFELARHLMWRPKLLILDEPLANLDVKAQAVVLNDLRSLANSLKFPMCIVISSQNLYEIEKISDNIIFLSDGNAAYNGPVGDIGKDYSFNCFELDANIDSTLELQKILKSSKVKEIRSTGLHYLVFTSKEVTSDELLNQLITQGVTVKLFRDISNSTRLLFENESNTENINA